MHIDDNTAARFWSKVNKDGPTMAHMTTPCWVWTGAITSGGYGCFQLRNKKILAHRASLAMDGRHPGPMWGLHHCDNRRCVRPDHLYVGTSDDNIADKIRRGRQPRGPDVHQNVGTSNAAARLTEDDVRWILSNAGHVYCTTMAKHLGVCVSTVRMVVRGDNWPHIHKERAMSPQPANALRLRAPDGTTIAPRESACPLCGYQLHWKTLGGMRLYTERDGVRVYSVRCLGVCGTFEVTLSKRGVPVRARAAA